MSTNFQAAKKKKKSSKLPSIYIRKRREESGWLIKGDKRWWVIHWAPGFVVDEGLGFGEDSFGGEEGFVRALTYIMILSPQKKGASIFIGPSGIISFDPTSRSFTLLELVSYQVSQFFGEGV